MRECGECNICCEIAEVREGYFNKPAGKMCDYCINGCELMDTTTRPKMCYDYQCAWSRGIGDIEDRPDKSKVMLSISKFNGGTWVFVQEIVEGAYHTTGENIIVEALKKIKLPAIISDYNTPIGEDTGDYVAILDEMTHRARNIIGKKKGNLGNNVTVYHLNK